MTAEHEKQLNPLEDFAREIRAKVEKIEAEQLEEATVLKNLLLGLLEGIVYDGIVIDTAKHHATFAALTDIQQHLGDEGARITKAARVKRHTHRNALKGQG